MAAKHFSKMKVFYLLLPLSVILLYKIIVFDKAAGSESRSKAESASYRIFDASLQSMLTPHPFQAVPNKTTNKGICAETLVWEMERDATWQSVDGSKKIYVISAYFIETQGKVYIIGAKPMSDVVVICQFWSKNGHNKYLMLKEVEAKVGTPNDPAGPLPYTAAIFECPLDSINTTVPSHVSLVTQHCNNPHNLVYVHNTSHPAVYKKRFTVCVAPIYSYGAAHEFVEWIELNRIFGADKFVLYNYSIAASMDQAIKYYIKQGLVEIIQWRLPFPGIHYIHYYGQTAALNDCLFRSKQDSEFITNIDIDEFIVPHSKNVFNWSQMLTQLNKESDGYIFRNTFFRKEWTGANTNLKQQGIAEKFQLITMKHIEHEQKLYPSYDRGKYFARTARAHYTLIHEIPRVRVQTVPTDIGLLHHYRNWQNYKDRQTRVKDLTIPEKFGNILLQNVQEIWNDLVKRNVSLNVSEIRNTLE